jgi:hypothetical protein
MDFYRSDTFKILRRWQKYIDRDGDFVECNKTCLDLTYIICFRMYTFVSFDVKCAH